MQNLLLSYYGDDLTGSTDVMEALELGGVPTVLFMRQPDEALLARFDALPRDRSRRHQPQRDAAVDGHASAPTPSPG